MPAPRARNIRGHSPWNDLGRVDLRLEVPAWTKDALCAEIGVEAFFGEGGGDSSTRLAKQACASCPVVNECLEMALGFEEWSDRYGIFGGTGPAERRALRREREQQAVAA